ncbi:NAD-dependent epimerase/dehydratase family protein [Candidatus Parcubacteria bacterium]|nr:NAD-dependent epimerase/dehydratase family protein [Candidatus Parcubacteria bacterium]
MSQLKNKKILITGGAGFIGSHLCEYFLKLGNSVISLDNYFTGEKDNHVKGVNYFDGHTKDIEKIITEKIDLVYHLGEYSRVLTSFDDVEKVLDFNILGTMAVLEYCRKKDIRLIYAGSSTKFGEFDDSDEAQNKTPYSWSKASNTELVNNYGKWFNLDYAITYFYNVYGQGEISDGKYATLIGIFIKKYKNKEPLTVTFPGTQRRLFTHVDDIVDGLVKVGGKGQGDGYCIGSKCEYSVLEIAKMFGGEIIMTPAKEGDRKFSRINTSKIKELGWESKNNIKDFIEKIKNTDE